MGARVNGRRATVLMLSDEPALLRLVRSILEPSRKVSGGTGCRPESRAAASADVVVIELNPVDPDTLAAVRSAHPDAALIVLSPEHRETDCIAALDMCADYLPRPFSPYDLAARVRVAELRRFAATGRPRFYRHGALAFDLFTGNLSINGRVVELAPWLRRKIEREPLHPKILLAEIGVGYRLAPLTSGIVRRQRDALSDDRKRA